MRREVGRFTYGFYTADGQPLGDDNRAYADDIIETYHTQGLAIETEVLEKYSVEKPKVFLEQEANAREFMASLGFTDLPEVYIVADDTEDVFGLRESLTEIATIPSHLDAVIFRQSRLVETDMYQRPVYIGNIITHEYSHAAILSDYIGVQMGSDTKAERDHGRGGFSVRGVDGWEGTFFEESFADYNGSRYSRMQQGDRRAIGINGVPGLEIPDYLLPPDPAMWSGPDGYTMELFAYGAEKKGIMSTDSFAELLLDTRREGTQANALRTFAQIVDEMEPGLYTDLRRLSYGKTDCTNACARVHRLVVAL